MDKFINLKTITTLFCLFLFCSPNRAQQRPPSQIDAIINQRQDKVKNNSNYTEKINSSSLFVNDELGNDKEAFYIYNTISASGKSFLIVSGDERMPTILAYSNTNSFDVSNMPPAARYWLECYVQEYKRIAAYPKLNKIHATSPTSIDGVAPLLGNIQWGQSTPFNNLCPTFHGEKVVTGCVATGMAQVMKYHEYPQKGKGYVSYRTSTNKILISHDFSQDIFDWSNMADTYKSYSEQQGNAVAVLMASCGASVQMDYCTSSQGGSGAYQSDLLKGYIEHFGYDKDAAMVMRDYCSTADWHKLLMNELNAGRPVNYGGSSMRDGGHSFVLDGYKISENTYPDYHVNWGWNGSCDGYYQIANLYPQEDGLHVTNGSFSRSQQMTLGIMPEDNIDIALPILCSSKLNCNVSKVNVRGSLSFNASSLYNCSYNTFDGRVSIALKGANNQLVVLDNRGTAHKLPYLNSPGKVSFTCTLPDTLLCGQYQGVLVYKQTGTNEWREIISSSYPQIEVAESSGGNQTADIWSEIGCSEFVLMQQPDPSVISANIYEIINLQETTFDGTLVFTLADENGSPFYTFGKCSQLPELALYDFMTTPAVISGSINISIPDGNYRLYLSAKRTNQTTNSYVVLNDLQVLGSPTHELYYHVSVKNEKAYINDKEYDIVPTSVNSIKTNTSSDNSIFSIDGLPVNQQSSNRSGIYILRSNGKTQKIIK